MNIYFLERAFQFFAKLANDLNCFKILILFDDNVFIFLIKHSHGFFLVARQKEMDRLYGELHLNDLVPPEVDKV